MRKQEYCSFCRDKLERGYLNTGSNALFWSEKKKSHSIGVEVIADSRFGFYMRGFEASQCPKFMLVFFSYERVR